MASGKTGFFELADGGGAVISWEIIPQLWSSGAKSEANTFDGERCMYGCLNDSIRRLLKEYKCVSVYAMKRGDFNYFLHM